MGKKYLDKDVYSATQERIAFLFSEFDNILVSFSGGKDSAVCLNICYDYAREHNILDRLAFYHLDYEAQYQLTTDFVQSTFQQFSDVRRYWCCLPIAAQCACKMGGGTWTPWKRADRALWVRDMPDSDCVINEDNAPFPIVEGETDYKFQDRFGAWFAQTFGKTAVVIGIRADESWNRYKLVRTGSGNLAEHRYQGHRWTVGDGGLYCAYPIYDWTADDVWTYNAKFGKQYNRIYDLYYQAGLKVTAMRVASPFNECAMDTLKLYKAIDPDMWGRMVSRVNGVNFAGIYGGTTAMGWRSIKLPENHTWKSYCYFLLGTLEEKLRKHYERILATSIEYWCEKGGYISDEIADEVALLRAGYDNNGKDPRFPKQTIYRFHKYPDDCETKSFQKLPSYKRMCVCILKNDYYCKYMGFSPTREAVERRRKALEKYANL